MRFTFIVVVLGIIIFIAAFFRLWRLGDVPSSLNWDEVALGYNAYSLLQTGKDEYGNVFPFVLRSYNDYKPGLYAYFVIPSIIVFELTPFAVRFPSAFFGILSVFATYFLAKELFAEKKYTSYYSLAAAFLLAISPWHIQFSRIAFESNVAVSFNILFTLFFLKGLKKPIFLPLSSMLMALNFYMYQSAKVFVPLLALSLFIIFRKELFRVEKKYLIAAVAIGLLVALPMVSYMLTSKEALARAQGVSIFSDTTPLLKENAQRLIVDQEKNDLLGLILDNRRVFYVKTVLAGYFSHFDLKWLFITGDIARHHAPYMGLLYLVELPFLLFGLYIMLFDDNIPKKLKLLIFTWFLITPIPASITSDVPHAVRTLNFLPLFQIFTALGFGTALIKVSSIKYQILRVVELRYLLFAFYFFLISFNFIYYFNQYFVQQNYFYARDWQYGYKQVIDYIRQQRFNNKKIIVSNKKEMSQSHMFTLFYLGYDPNKYLSEGGTRTDENNKFSNFEFRSFEYDNEHNVFLVGSSTDFPESLEPLYTIYYPDKTIAIKIVEKD